MPFIFIFVYTLSMYYEDDISRNLGRKPELGERAEQVLVEHIKNFSDHGFSLTRTQVRALAFQLAESLQIKHRFSKESKQVGWEWLWGFLRRHNDLSIRNEENLPIHRALAMTKVEVDKFFDLLNMKL